MTAAAAAWQARWRRHRVRWSSRCGARRETPAVPGDRKCTAGLSAWLGADRVISGSCEIRRDHLRVRFVLANTSSQTVIRAGSQVAPAQRPCARAPRILADIAAWLPRRFHLLRGEPIRSCHRPQQAPLRVKGLHFSTLRTLICSLALSDRIDAAPQMATKLMKPEPALTVGG